MHRFGIDIIHVPAIITTEGIRKLACERRLIGLLGGGLDQGHPHFLLSILMVLVVTLRDCPSSQSLFLFLLTLLLRFLFPDQLLDFVEVIQFKALHWPGYISQNCV